MNIYVDFHSPVKCHIHPQNDFLINCVFKNILVSTWVTICIVVKNYFKMHLSKNSQNIIGYKYSGHFKVSRTYAKQIQLSKNS